jgi:RecT family
MSMIDVREAERRIADRVDSRIARALEISRQAGGLGFTNAGEAMEFAKMMAVSQIGVRKHLRGNPGACLAITVQSIEWGMSPFAVANKSYLVNDQIAYESQLVQAVILRRAPINGRFKYSYTGEGERRRCKVMATLIGGETVDYETPEIGKIPVKNSPLWKGDPDQQLAYYAGRALCRRHFPDVLLGIYDVDELTEHPRDAERARDVTAPAGLAGRLSALVAPRAAADHLIEHDPVTGDVKGDPADGAGAGQENGEDGAPSSTEAAGEPAPKQAESPAADPFDDKSLAWRFGWEAAQARQPRSKPPSDLAPDEAEDWQAGHDAFIAQNGKAKNLGGARG